MMPALLFDVAAPGVGEVEIGLAIALFLAFAALGLIVFKLLRKVLRTAFRVAIVGLILIVGVAGSVSLYMFASGSTPKARPARTRGR